MTIATTASKITYTGNDAATTFAWNFRIDSAADLEVILTSAGLNTVLSTTLYSATGFGSDSGGTVTYPLSGSPLTTAQKLTIQRKPAILQDTDFSNQGTQYPEAIERAIDRVVMMVQQNAEVLARALVLSVTDGALPALPPAAQRANKYLSFDASGNPSVATTIEPGTLTVSAFMQQVINAAGGAEARTELGIGSTGTLGDAGADTLLGNPSGATAPASYNSLNAYLDRTIATRGAMLRRGNSAWNGLALGDAGDVLGSDGTDLVYVKQAVGEGSYRNLVVAATADTTVTVTADWIVANNSSNSLRLLRNVSLTIGTGTSGANGLDTGSIADNTWYSVWIIFNPTTAITAGLLSLSTATPTLPSGFTFSIRVGWVRRATGVLRRTRQVGARANYIQNSSVEQPPEITGIGTGLSVVSIENFVPVTAVIGEFRLIARTASAHVTVSPSNMGSPLTSGQLYNITLPSTNFPLLQVLCSFVLEARSIYTQKDAASSTMVQQMGWTDSI